MPKPLQAVSIGAIILFVVVATPMLVNSTSDGQSQTFEIEENATERINDRLEVENVRIRPPSPENATFTVRDTESLDSDTQTIQTGGNATYELSGGNVTVSLVSVTDGTPETALVTVETESMYGWSDGAQTVGGNLPLIIVAVAFIILLALLVSVIQ